MNDLVQLLICGYIIFGGGFAWVLGLGQLCLEYKTQKNYLLASHFFFLGCWQILGGSVFLGAAERLPFNIFVLIIPCFFASLPLLYLYSKGIVDHQHKITSKHLFHFVPPILSAFILAPFFMTRVSLYPVMNFFRHANYRTDELLMSIATYMAMLIFLGYQYLLAVDFKLLLKDVTGNQKRFIRYLLYGSRFMILLAVFWFVDRIFTLGWAQLIYVIVSTIIIATYLISSRYPELLLMVQLEVEKVKYSKSQIENLDTNDVITRLEKTMQTQKAFLTDDINLQDLASAVNVTPHQLSEVLNRKLNKSFNLLINEYRIKEAKQILVQSPDRKILAIAYDVGFNSPSAFYKAFQKLVGMTPTQFRQKNP